MRPSRVTLEQAQELFKTCMSVRKKEEKRSADCLGQILAKPVYAAVTQPPFPRSAMDGFALRSRVQVYDRGTHQWTDMTEWAFLGYQERKKALLGKDYEPPIYLD